MSRLQSVAIRRFKRLRDVEVPLADTTLLIGTNNSGKSSVLQAIHFAVAAAQTAKLLGGVNWANDKYQLSFNPSELLYSPVADVMSLAYGGALQERADARVEVVFRSNNGSTCAVCVRRGRNRNIALEIEGRALGQHLMDLQQPFSVYAPGLAGIPKQETCLSPGVVRRVVARGDANLVLRNVLLLLSKDNDSWNTFQTYMRALFPGIEIAVDFDSDIDEHIEAGFRFPSNRRYPLDAAGTSILQASQLLAYVLLFRPQVLVLDEPDSHLHPNNQRALCQLITRLTRERDFQVLISTHSRHVFDALRDGGEVLWLSHGEIVAERDLATTEMLLELGALDSVDYFARGAIRCVVATEDSDLGPIRALIEANGFAMRETEITSYAGCTKVEAAIVLGRFLRERARNLAFVVHRDRDYLPPERVQDFERTLANAGVSAFVTEGSDVEWYFLRADHVAHVNPGITIPRAQELIEEAITTTSDRSIKALVDHRTQEAYRVRREGGAGVDHGGIAVAASADYRADPHRMCRGKETAIALGALLRRELRGAPSRLFAPSPFLQLQPLTDISARLWPRD